MTVSIRPTRDNVVVRRDEPDSKIGSILLPEHARTTPFQGVVVAVGPGWPDVPLSVAVGDKVMFDRRAGRDVVIDKQTLVVLREESIIGVFAS